MDSRFLFFALLLPALVFASADPGDTLLSQSSNLDLGSWVIDGTKVSTQYICTDLIPGTCSYSLNASDSISSLPGSPAGGVFLRVLSANSLSPVPTKRQATFVHGEWWKIKGKTGDWALEIDSSYFQSHYAADQMPDTLIIHPHWARIQPGRSWVKWVDTIKNQLVSNVNGGKILTTETKLLRCLVDSSCRIDTIYGRIEAVYPNPYHFKGVYWNTGISVSFPDSLVPYFSSVLDSNGSKASTGMAQGVRVGDSGSTVVGTFVVWTSNSPAIPPYSWQNLPNFYDMEVAAIWIFRIMGTADSIISLGVIPTGGYEGILPRNAAATQTTTSLHAVDPAGRPVPLGQALPIGPHLATLEGRLQTVIVRP